jgi:hypothetical protein
MPTADGADTVARVYEKSLDAVYEDIDKQYARRPRKVMHGSTLNGLGQIITYQPYWKDEMKVIAKIDR